MYAAHGQMLTTVGMADRTRITLPAVHIRFDDDPFADLEQRLFRRHLDHFAGNFVPDDARIRHQGIHALVGADIGTANTGATHADQHFVAATLLLGQIDQGNLARGAETDGFHGFPHISKTGRYLQSRKRR